MSLVGALLNGIFLSDFITFRNQDVEVKGTPDVSDINLLSAGEFDADNKH